MRASSGPGNRHLFGAEATPPARPIYQHWAFWAAFVLFAVFPAACVNSASPTMRVGWAILVSMVFVLTIAIDAGVRNKPKARLTGSYFRRTQPVRQAIIVGAPILALISSVAATYATPERPPLWHVTVFVAQIGSAIFPVVGKLATHIVPALPPVTLYKAQFVVTLFMLASLTLIITTISIVLFMSRSERRALREATERSGYRSRSPAIIWLTSPFLVGFGLALYFGWLGFTPEPKDMQGARCLVTAACYVQNDILLLAAALIDAGMSLIVWAGTFIMLRNSIDRGVS